jgi:4-coumarate--CoA ligase
VSTLSNGRRRWRRNRNIPLSRNKNTTGSSCRLISSTSILRYDGELAERCNANVVSSPSSPITESWDKPLPDFVMSKWKKKQETGGRARNDDDDGHDDLAIFDGSTGMKRTFGDYYHDTAGIAGSLKHDLGIDESSCVCLFAPNHVDYLPVTLAVGLCGAKITPVNPLYKPQELQVVLDKSKSSVLIAHKDNLDVALQAAKGAKYIKHVLVMTEDGEAVEIDGLESLESIKQHSQSFDTTSDSYHCEANSHPYLLPYSSGTTGLPKGVCLTHANLTVNLLQMDVTEGPPLEQFGGGLFSPLPFFHIYGMVVSMMYCGWKGCPLYTMSGRFDFELMLDMIQKHQPKNAHLVPPIILALAKSPLVDQYDISSLHTIISAASPLGVDTETAVQKRLVRCKVKQAWGMSELSPIGTISPSSNIKVGSVGPLVSNTFGKIIDPDSGESLGPNREGELIVKGPQVMMGYLDEPEKTKECMSSSGWLRTGDFAYYDDDGYFYITDRIKELIKVRAFQVAPAELEDLLLGHENVNDVAVIQIPDEESGELPLAYIVLKDGCSDEKADQEKMKENIYEWVKERVAPHKRLDGGITFVDSIPKSASGKILRRILRDELAEQIKG